MNPPIIIEAESFQDAYFAALREIHRHKWECWKLVTQSVTVSFRQGDHARVTAFALSEGLYRLCTIPQVRAAPGAGASAVTTG